MDLDPKLRLLLEVLRVQGFSPEAADDGFRMPFDNGCDVDFYLSKSPSPSVRGRVKFTGGPDDSRETAISDIQAILAAKLAGLASIAVVEQVKDTPREKVYDVRIDMTGAPLYQETVVIEEDTELVAVRDTEELTEAAVAGLEQVDAGMIRQALDSLNLPRSSGVRLVLSRLYRSAGDLGELKGAAAAEANKIIKVSEVDELKMLRRINTFEFLDPLIELVWRKVTEGRVDAAGGGM
mgnify:CR=1 FL=1